MEGGIEVDYALLANTCLLRTSTGKYAWVKLTPGSHYIMVNPPRPIGLQGDLPALD